MVDGQRTSNFGPRLSGRKWIPNHSHPLYTNHHTFWPCRSQLQASHIDEYPTPSRCTRYFTKRVLLAFVIIRLNPAALLDYGRAKFLTNSVLS